jgi:NAD(P)-dependent dehydrogenase (short-subunit alcohol dehydrogenase family)
VSLDPFGLNDRVALVTGASGVLGRHFASVLHGAGATVALAARRFELVAATAAALGERAIGITLDVTDNETIEAALDGIEARYGTPDVIINNSGIAVSKRILEQTDADWDDVMAVNLRGAFLVARATARRLIAMGRPGVIVNIASIIGSRPMPGVAAYGASKAGLLQLTRQMAVELARHRIRVNALAPGYVETDMNAEFFASPAGRALVDRIPQRRLGTPDDLTGPLLLLASDASAHMTGSVITVDGGHSINSL